jgi:hypothetical protein
VHAAVLWFAIASLLAQDNGPSRAIDAKAEDPKATVFVPDACGADEGAPPKASLGKLVVLTDLGEGDPYRPVLDLLRQGKRPAAVVSFPAGKIAAAKDELSRLLPEFVLVVTHPERIDVNLHFELIETAASLDADPFVDFAFGYVTGATPDEALAFGRRILAMGAKAGALPKSVVEFGPASSGKTEFVPTHPHRVAKGFKESCLWHGPVADLLAKKEMLRGAGIVRAGGHGEPHRIVDGLTGEDLRKHKIDFAPALYFSGPCYCGVTGPWFDASQGVPKRVVVEPMKSFALATIACGVTALFAGLDPDRGETCSQELEHLVLHGDALGHASKETYDGAALALRRPEPRLFRYSDGGARPQRNLADTMIGGGASRALFGDPTFLPFAQSADPPCAVKQKDGAKALEVSWSSERGPTDWWSCVDVYRCDGGWTHRVAFREKIPVETARKLKTFSVARLVAKDGPLEGRFATAMVERWGGKAFLHVYVVFPPAGQENVFFVKRDFEARFLFGK